MVEILCTWIMMKKGPIMKRLTRMSNQDHDRRLIPNKSITTIIGGQSRKDSVLLTISINLFSTVVRSSLNWTDRPVQLRASF